MPPSIAVGNELNSIIWNIPSLVTVIPWPLGFWINIKFAPDPWSSITRSPFKVNVEPSNCKLDSPFIILGLPVALNK